MAANHDIPPDFIPYLLHEKIDNSSLQSSLLKVNIAFIITVLVAASLRFTVRFRILRSAGLDDRPVIDVVTVLMIIAVTFAISLSTACLVARKFGIGKHIWNLSPNLDDLQHDIGVATKSLYGCYLAYSTTITFTKLSIMATCIRIFPNGTLRYIVYANGSMVITFWFTTIFTVIFTCVPVRAAWDYSIKNPKCIHIIAYYYTAAGVNIATDLLVCFLPLPTIWKLQMPKAQRVAVCFIFGMGTFACAASIVRLTQLHHLTGIDITYQVTGSLNWSVIEVGTAIVCSSLSSLRPLATRYLPSLFAHLSKPESDPPSFRLDTPSSHPSKFRKHNPQLSSTATVVEKGNDSMIYVQRSFDVTGLGSSPNESKGEMQVGAVGMENTKSRASAVWIQASRGESEEILVRDPCFENALRR